MNAYRQEADALDEAVLGHITAWHESGTQMRDDRFNALALRIFAHQLRYNKPYARYCATLGFDAERLPRHWTGIPPVPSAAFKEAALATFPIERA
ncbi:MAG: acyl-protein synthetase, partial [Candidatus Eremiobacteraeota bacterium]|nr:acyl-protein synthetase [Candidatus Eremiobacteraeota bacterium]